VADARSGGDEVRLDDVRVLVVATEQVGVRMAGPAIRSRNLADQLARRGASVTLALPRVLDAADAAAADLPASVELVAYGTPSARSLGPLARRADVVVTQPQRVDVAWALARSGARIVYDLYVPSFVERIAQLGTEPGDERLKQRLLERDRREYAAAIELGDAFCCASERQRDLWLGALGQAGRLDLGLLERDARADELCAIVAFGTGDEPPDAADAPSPMRGTLVPEDAIVALWTGGLWNWFDPVCVVEALAVAREHEPRLQLVVMGMHHPEAAWHEQDVSRRMRERAGELGLLEPGGGVVLLDTWVAYAERGRWLLDADLAVSAHHDSLETRFSFRTRFLDHLWAGVPTLTTAGGELTERMSANGAALEVADGDVQAWKVALLDLAHDADRRAQMSIAARELAGAYRWSLTTEPLARSVRRLADARAAGAPVNRSPRRVRALASYVWLLVRVRVQAKGLASLAGAVRGASSR
jgi:glycosyltransferase involved in cell wall biosynthesis